jgi:hypothetical protein
MTAGAEDRGPLALTSFTMDLAHGGWLLALIDDTLARYDPVAARARVGAIPVPTERVAAARAYVGLRLRAAGLAYGTPVAVLGIQTNSREEALLLAILCHLMELALDVAILMEAAHPERRRQDLAILAAVLADRVDIAEKIAADADGKKTASLLARAEKALEARATSLAGDPVYGLPLHNGATWADARAFGRTAIAMSARGRFDPRAARRRREFAAREKAAFVEAVCALASTDRPPSFTARRAILRQIDDLQLPGEIGRNLRIAVRRTFTRPPPPEALALRFRSASARRFILEQTVLASLIDGRRSPGELAFLKRLAAALGFAEQELREVEVAVAEFYAKNRDYIDAFTVQDKAAAFGEEMVDQMVDVVELNLERVMQEIRKTGELSVLLAKLARGGKLTRVEKHKVREQLLDVAKTIPALAVFAAPGGLLLLVALARVLPFNILPSSFADEPEGTPPEPRPLPPARA